MSVARTQACLDAHHSGLCVIDTGTEIATVDAAASALGVAPAQIDKTLAVRAADQPIHAAPERRRLGR